ncbi:MAG: GntR family transcriptional regulator [bacterium]
MNEKREVKARMLFKLNPSSGVPVYRQIIDQVKHGLASGLLQEGDKLPTVKAMASDLGINPNTVAKAYYRLEGEGYLNGIVGSGVYVTGRPRMLVHEEKLRLLRPYVTQMIVEAMTLNLSRDVVDAMIKEEWERWGAPKRKGKSGAPVKDEEEAER